MKILFVHQCFPGQYRHILRSLSGQGHTIIGLGISELSESIPADVTYLRYPLLRGNTTGIHPWLVDVDSKLIRGESCANVAYKLMLEGFVPDIICSHPGWGESLFLSDIWPQTPLLCYQEFYYNPLGFDYDFDPELQGVPEWTSCALLRLKNANPLLALASSTWNVTPTLFQKSTFPTEYQQRISVIHDGIDTKLASPDSSLASLCLPDGFIVTKSTQVITFVNRCIEPYRGCHTMIRAIPQIQKLCPQAHIIIVGSTTGVSYGKRAHNDSWMEIFLDQIKGLYDPTLVHFTGTLAYPIFIDLLRLSSCHVYLTYPFVLSWSLLEAMSVGVPIVASSTSPVKEVISDSQTGILVDFFSTTELAYAIQSVIYNNKLANHISSNARQLILNQYSLEYCIPKQLELIDRIASRSNVNS